MHWFGGTMAEAVTLSKQKNAIFVVFVEDDNQLSKELAETLEDGAVLKRLSDQNNFLAVKLRSGSENYTFFAQIYQFVPVPSLFFIGRNGTPLEVVCAGVQPEQLASRIDRILEEHRKDQKPGSVQPSTSSRNIKDETVNFMQTEASALTAQSQPKPVEKAPEVAPTVPQSAPTVPQSAPTVPQSAPAVPQSAPTIPQSAPTLPQSAPTVPQSAPAVPQSAPTVPQSAPTLPQTVPSGQQTAQKTSAAKDEEPETSSGPAAKIQKTEHHEVTRSGQEYDVICDGDVCVRRPRVDQAGPSQRSEPPTPETAPVTESESEPLVDDKVERAKELLNARRREKEEKEKELEKQKEMERRAVGQGVAELKRWQADQEMKQIQEERKREKMENNLVRQRILEQIAQDRAERKAREQPSPPASAPTQVTPPASVGDSSGRARVQFKLPDGAAHTAHFEVTATLRDVHRYVADNLQMSRSSFSLWTAFPRRELTETDATLLELQLAPSAALLVLQRRTDTVAATPNMFASVITFVTQIFTSIVLDPSYQLYTWLRSRFFPSPSNRPATPTPPANPPTPGAVRRRGNFHRVTADRADDDDNNTWNGNSTQQM